MRNYPILANIRFMLEKLGRRSVNIFSRAKLAARRSIDRTPPNLPPVLRTSWHPHAAISVAVAVANFGEGRAPRAQAHATLRLPDDSSVSASGVGRPTLPTAAGLTD